MSRCPCHKIKLVSVHSLQKDNAFLGTSQCQITRPGITNPNSRQYAHILSFKLIALNNRQEELKSVKEILKKNRYQNTTIDKKIIRNFNIQKINNKDEQENKQINKSFYPMPYRPRKKYYTRMIFILQTNLEQFLRNPNYKAQLENQGLQYMLWKLPETNIGIEEFG